jgi:hypothetical protein
MMTKNILIICACAFVMAEAWQAGVVPHQAGFVPHQVGVVSNQFVSGIQRFSRAQVQVSSNYELTVNIL